MLKVSAKSHPARVAGAVAANLRDKGEVDLQAIGASAVNQCVKAIAVARGFVAPEGIDIVCVPGFVEIQLEDTNTERTAVRFHVTKR